MRRLITGHLLMIDIIKMTIRPIYVLTKISFSPKHNNIFNNVKIATCFGYK